MMKVVIVLLLIMGYILPMLFFMTLAIKGDDSLKKERIWLGIQSLVPIWNIVMLFDVKVTSNK